MSVREFVVLGTGAEVPGPTRNLHGLLLRWDEHGILIDPGEGTQRQMIYSDVTATSLTRVFISRFHPDACLGLAGICQRISLDRVPHSIAVHFPASGRVFYERLRKASVYHAAARLDPRPVEDAGEFHGDEKFTLRSAKLDHPMECFGLRLDERDRRTMLPDRLREAGVFGPTIKRLQQEGQVEVEGRTVHLEDVSVPRPGQAVAYLGPTRPCRGAMELLRGVDVAFCHAPFEDPKQAERQGKMTAEEAGRLARAAGVGHLVLTGFHRDGPPPERLVEQVRAGCDAEVTAAEDGLRVPIPKPKPSGGAA